MKNICFVKYDMLDSSGGARVCANLANALKDKCKVHVVSICSESDDTFYSLDGGVEYRVLMHGSGRIRETLVKGTRLLKEYFKENDIDMAFAVGVSINPFVVNAAKGTKCKSVAWEQLNCLSEYENDLAQRFCRYLGARHSDKVITITKRDRDAYIQKYKLNPDKVVNIYNWIDESLLSEESSYNPKLKTILTVVRIAPVKGIENIIEVSKRLKDELPDWQWHIYGGGDETYFQQLQSKIDESGLSEFVILKGQVSDIYERYCDYGLSVLTSYCEGFALVLAEAKAKRIPNISFDCLMGPSDIIRDGEDGYLVKVGDLEDLYNKLRLCMSDEGLRVKLSKNAYGNIDKFSKKEIVKKWTELIGE